MSVNTIVTVLATLFVGGLGMLAQWAKKSQGAEVTLVVTLLALSVLEVLFGGIAGIGLLLRSSSGEVSFFRQLVTASAGVAAILAGLVGIGLCVPPLRKILRRRPEHSFWTDPPILFALWITVAVLANNVLSILIFTQAPDVADLFPTGRLSPGAVALAQLPLLVVAILGVGFGIRRSLRDTLRRLGYGGVSARHLGIIVVFIAAAYGMSIGADSLFSLLQPDLYRTVGEVSGSLFSTKGLSPLAAILFGLLVGLGAAAGEETLFRGAVQPVLGIPLTSILFASMHIQYGPSVILVYVFALSIGLGLLRRHINTTASFLAHAGYNFILTVMGYLIGT
jgi:membrane protease YdiL (CAAX protease family)